MIKELETKLYSATKDLDQSGKDIIKDALAFAKNVHKGQLRKTGEAYITHPMSVALMLAQQKFDLDTIVGAILHDTLEDGDIEFSDIKNRFGSKIASLVDGVTKISNIKLKELSLNFDANDIYEGQVDTYRKLLLAMAKDIRVIIIKLFDRYHNAQTFKWLTPQKREFYARETIDIYAQIAERIGIGKIKAELEDLSFPYAYPDEFAEYTEKLKDIQIDSKVIDRTIKEVKNKFDNSNIKIINIYGRTKHSYSTYRKLKYSYNWDISRFYDLYAIRIILESVEDCYRALGTIHSMYEPISGTFDDYIAKPRDNGYQSLQTALKNKAGDSFEIQLRTAQMHEVAEYGMAAHWHYKELINSKNEHALLASQKEWQKELNKLGKLDNKKQFVSHLREDLFAEKIFVFTPKGKIINLPINSTPIDFAYAVHSSVGDRTCGAKIRGRIVPLDFELHNGDIVEIITSPKSKPSPDWLTMVKTSGAKQKIRKFLREVNRDYHIIIGRRSFNEAVLEFNLLKKDDNDLKQLLSKSRLPYNNLDDVFIAFAENHISKMSILKVFYPNFSNKDVCELPRNEAPKGIDTLSGIRYVYAGCCKPVSSDNTFGYIGKDHIIKIHKKSCKLLQRADKNRIIEI